MRSATAVAAGVDSRTTKSLLAYGAQTICSAVTVAGGFLITPLLIHLLGDERFGLFRVVNDWMANVALLEFGLGGSVAVALVSAIQESDSGKACTVLNEGFRACGAIGLLMLGGSLVVGLLLPWMVPHTGVSSLELRLAVMALSLTLCAFPTSVFRTLFEVRQQGYVISVLLIAQSLLTFALQLSSAFLGFGLTGLSLAAVIAQTPMVAVLTYRALRLYPRFWLSRRDPAVKKRLWSVNLAIFVCATMGRIGLYSDNLIVGKFLGGAAISSFFLTQRLAITAQTQLQAVGNASWAGLMELAYRGESDRFESRLAELTSIVSGLGIAVLCTICLLNPFFIAKWLGTGLFAGSWVNGLGCVSVWLWSIQSLWGWPIDASGNSRRFVPYAIACAALNLTLSAGATRLVGAAGPLLGTIFTFLAIYSWSVPKILKEIFYIKRSRLLFAAVQPLVWGLPNFLVGSILVRMFPPHGWLLLSAEALAIGTTGLLCWWRFTCTRQSRRLWLDRFQLMFFEMLTAFKRPKFFTA